MHQPHLSRSSRWFLLVRSSCAFIHCTETLTICKRNFDDFKWKGSEQSIPRTKWTSNLSDHWSLGVLCSVKLHSLHCLISVSGSMLNPLSPFINVIWFQVFILWTIKGQKCSCSEADYDDGLFFFIDVELLHWLSAYPTKCNEWTRRLVTASPLPLVSHVHQWLHCMLQITACFRYTPPPPHQPISDRTLSPLTVPGIHPLRATCHRHSLLQCNLVFHITQNARVRIDEVSYWG